MDSIIWDWNGTLLSDVELCIDSMNVLLQERDLPLLSTQIYRELFSFPVRDYYESIGFDFEKEDFSVPAHRYIELYNEGFDTCTLQTSAKKVLSYFSEKKVRQFVLSAMEHEMLLRTIEKKGITAFFEGIAGIEDFYAVSKIDQGKKLIDKHRIAKEKVVLIGDTVHDFEVAEALGIKCILVADGHQSEERLRKTGALVIGNLKDLLSPELGLFAGS